VRTQVDPRRLVRAVGGGGGELAGARAHRADVDPLELAAQLAATHREREHLARDLLGQPREPASVGSALPAQTVDDPVVRTRRPLRERALFDRRRRPGQRRARLEQAARQRWLGGALDVREHERRRRGQPGEQADQQRVSRREHIGAPRERSPRRAREHRPERRRRDRR
jgi:hypothetical protein